MCFKRGEKDEKNEFQDRRKVVLKTKQKKTKKE